MSSPDREPRRTYTETELWMSYGLTAGLLIGAVVQVLTGRVVWTGLIFMLGLVTGMLIGQARDRRQDGDDASDDGG